MQYIIDIVFLAIFGLIIAVSAKKGFFLTLFELGAYLISIVTSKILSASIAPQVYENFFSRSIKQSVTNALGDVSSVDVSVRTAAAIDSIPEQFDGLIKLIGIDKTALVNQVASSNLSGEKFIQNFMDTVISPISTAVIRVLLFIAISFVLSLVLRIVVKLLNKVIKKLPVIGDINSGLGAVLGIVKGLLVVVLLALILSSVSSFIASKPFVDAVGSSVIVKAVNGILVSISGYSV